MHPLLAKIPLLRRPFYRLETAQQERDAALQERAAIQRDLAAAQQDLAAAQQKRDRALQQLADAVTERDALLMHAALRHEEKFPHAIDDKLNKINSPCTRRCIFCTNQVDAWIPFRIKTSDIPEFLTTFDSVGSNVERFQCPHCGSIDRERHLHLFLRRLRITESIKGAAVLHIAPEFRLPEFIESHAPSLYVKGDLLPGNEAIQRVDVQNISYPDETFDLVICNHVLEHVENVQAALRELRRVLKPGGRLICQTPFARRLKMTLEGSSLQSAEERLFFYGQEDHLRLFGADIEQTLGRAGFVGRLVPHVEILPDIDPEAYGINEHEPFFDFSRGLEQNVATEEKQNPLISIVLLCYNQERFVGEALDGLFAQTYSPLEIVIIDDGSPDGTAAVIESKLANYQGRLDIRFIRNEHNIGANAAMRIGLNLVKGAFIHAASGDDIVLPEFIAKMAEVWMEQGVSLVTTNAYYIDADSRPLNRTFRDPTRPGDDRFETLARDGANDCCFGPAIGFDREVYSTFGWPPTYLHAYDIMYPFYAYLLNGARFVATPLMKYRSHSNNTSLSLIAEKTSESDQLIPKERIFYGHLAHSLLMQDTLERMRQQMPDRYSAVAEKIAPLLTVQMVEIAKKFVDARSELDRVRHRQSLSLNPTNGIPAI